MDMESMNNMTLENAQRILVKSEHTPIVAAAIRRIARQILWIEDKSDVELAARLGMVLARVTDKAQPNDWTG